MRHRVAHRKLGRVTEHRISMLRNQATALLKYEHLTTTVPKAKELRPFVERLITVAKRGLAAGEANGRVLNARRLVMQDLQDREVVSKLFDTIAPRFAARPGGYTRLMRTGYRKGDGAELAHGRTGRQRVRSERQDRGAQPKRPSRRARASAAGCARRPNGCAAPRRATTTAARSSAKPTKGAGAGRRSTTPRKAGGS